MTRDFFSDLDRAAPGSRSGFSRRQFLWRSGLALALASPARALSLFGAPVISIAPVSSGCLSPYRTGYPPQLQNIIAKLDPAADDFPTEEYAEQFAKILSAWSATLCGATRDLKAIRENLTDPILASSLQPFETTPLRVSGPLHIEKRQFHSPETFSREKFLSSLSSCFSPFAKIELVELEIYAVRVVGDSPLSVETEMRCDIVGNGNDGRREQRVGSWTLSWIRDERQIWRVRGWNAGAEVRSRLRGPGFSDITASCVALDGPGMKQLLPGIDDWRTSLDGACGIDVYGNHGIAVGDIDGSGCDSFYVCQPSGLPNRLYKNRGDGTFEDITESSGVGILDGTASALFADFFNRGKQDLLVVRTGGPLLFISQGGGRFELRPDAFQFASVAQGTFTSAAIADYNRDGLLDVYFCVYSYYQGLNQYQFPAPYYDAQNGPPNFLFRNRGDGSFEDVTAAAGLHQNNNRFSFAAAWCDYDNSGWPSLYVANDFGRKNLYHSNGDGTFTDIADSAGVQDYGPGMSACWLDYDNDGLQDAYVANMWLPEGKRITSNDRFLPGAAPAIRALYQKHNAGNSLYRNAGNGKFQDKSTVAGAAMGRWSWSCASWDFDHDGFPDLYVATGFVSGPNRFDLQSFFWRQVAQHSLAAAGTAVDYEMAWNAVNELVRSDYSWSGYQRNVFFANNHDGTFSDVSGVLGLDLRDDSRAYALSDFDHDGRMEFVLKNRTGPQLRILRNNLGGLGNSVGLRLTGRASNRDAIGAVVTVEAAGKRQTKFLSAGSGFASQHTKELFFGVGSASNNVSVAVRWPTGVVERFENVPLNHRVEIAEGDKGFKATAYRSTPSYAETARTAPVSPPARATVSTWLLAPLYGPDVMLPDLSGEIHHISSLRGQPIFLTFFAVNCEDSRQQIEQLQDASAAMSAAGLSVLSVAVNSGPDRAALEEFVRSSHITVPILLADERTLGAWNIQYRYLFDRRRDMSFPTSFLIDRDVAIVRIYQGNAEPADIIADWKSSPATPAERFACALPFPGPYYGNPMNHNYFTYGIAFVEYGYLDEAQAALQRAVDANPNYAAAWFNLGTIFLNKKQYPEARRCLLEAVRLDSRDTDAWNNLGMVSGEQGNYDEALEEFQKSARANPNNVLPVQNMVRIYRFQGRAADAQKALEELIALAPNNADLHLAVAMTLVAQNEIEDARRELETAVRLRPDNTDAINDLGVVLLRLGKSQEALERFEECQRISPEFDRPFINAALIYNTSGQPAKARQILEQFLVRHPDNADVRGALEKLGAK
ncbi:MAG: FG-GAP-like repeat-containing protein [Candidatus Acidiferrales bacterium]